MGGFDAIGEPLDLVDAIAVRGAQVEGVLLLADSLGRISDQFGWCLSIPSAAPGSLGRYLIPASLQATQFRGPVLNLAAVVAWAGWHPPDAATDLNGVKPSQIDDMLRSPTFRDADRAGVGGVRVLDVKATTPTESGSDPADIPRKVTPHLRRGHWRKQRHGPQASLIKRIRIAPVAVNAHLGAMAPRVYRLTSDERGAMRSTR
jgi:hypothetical protein